MVYHRYDLHKVHFESAYGGAIGTGGITPRASAMVYLPLKNYLPPVEWEKSNKRAWTIKAGGRDNCKITKGIAPMDATAETAAKLMDGVYTVESVKVCDYGSPGMHHLEVVLK